MNVQPKSNFDFLKDTKFYKTIAGEEIYKCALYAENTYKNNREICALKARLFLENFMRFVVTIKDLKFPKEIRTVGDYYCFENRSTLLSVFKSYQKDLIIKINKAAIPYLHAGLYKDYTFYKGIVEDIHTLLVWLINELDSSVKVKPKFNKDLLPDNPYLSEDFLYAPVKNIPLDKSIKKFFPNCNPDKLYQVEKKDDSFVLKDINTGKIVETIDMDSENRELVSDVDTLRRQMEEVQNKYNKLSDNLQNAVNKEKYLEDMEEQAHRYNEIKEQITDLVPSDIRLAEMKEDLKRELNDKSNIIKQQQTQIDDLQGRINDTKQNLRDQKKQLASINNELASAGIRMTESDAMLSHMSQRLMENDEELETIRKETKDAIRKIQQGYEEQGFAFYKKLDSIEKVLTQIALENTLLKEKLEAIDTDRTQPISEYAVICKDSLKYLNESCKKYAQDCNIEEFKKRIAEAYMNYTNRVNNLDKEHDAQQSSGTEIYDNKPDIPDVEYTEVPEKNNAEGIKNSNRYKKVIIAAVFLIVVLTGSFLVYKIMDVQDQNDKLMEMLTEKLKSSDRKTAENDDKDYVNSEEKHDSEEKQDGEEKYSIDGNLVKEPNVDSDPVKEPNVDKDPVKEPNNMIPVVDDLYNAIETPIKAPASIKSIKGVNPKLVSDIDNPDRQYFNGQLDDVPDYSANSSNRESYIEKHEDIFEYIGRYGTPSFQFYSGYSGPVSCFVGSNSYLIRYKPAKAYKFVYCRDGVYDNRMEYVAGILPNELCDSIDANSSLEDFQKVLGTRYNTIYMRFSNKTELSTADVEHGYVFTCENGDAVAIFYDENEKLCDYLYLLLVE